MRRMVGYGSRSHDQRRALKTCGTRQASARVGVSPWQKRPVSGLAASSRSRAVHPSEIQRSYQRCRVGRSKPYSVQQRILHALIVQWLDVAGD